MAFRVRTLALVGLPCDNATVIIAFGSIAAASIFSEKPLTPEVIFPAAAVLTHLSVPLAMVCSVISRCFSITYVVLYPV